VPSLVSEASAVRHAHQGQGSRGNSSSAADAADHASPFASLLDGANDTPPSPASPPPASPPPASQKPQARPPDGQTTQPSSAATAPSPQKSSSGGSTPESQTGGAASSPGSGPKGTDIAQTALGALAKKAAKDTKSTIDPNADSAVTTVTTGGTADATAGNNAVSATASSSTAAAIANIPGDTTVKSDSSATDTAQAAAPPADPSANQPAPATPQPVAVAISAPVIPAVPSTIGSGGGSGGGSGSGSSQDVGQIAALGDAVKAGAPRGKADSSGADAANKSSGTPADTPTGGGTKPGAKTADAAKATPSLAPQPVQKEPIPPTGPVQPSAADGSQSGNPDGGQAAEAANNRARARTVTSQPTDGATATGQQGNANVDPNVDPSVDSKRDPAGSANRIEDITRQALDATVRRVEAPAAEIAGGSASHPESVQAGGVQQSPDGSGGTNPTAILTTSAASASAPVTTAAPAAVPIAGLAVEIASHAHAGKNRFEIRLDPPELGRIDVRLDVDREGKVTSRLVVDRPETLDILRRDAPELERSLQQAGLKTADNALQFSLRDHGGFGGQNQNPYPNDGPRAGATSVVIPDRELPPVEATTAAHGRMIGRSAGVDIRV